MLLTILLYALPVLTISYLITTYLSFRSIPGPFLAKFTNLHRFISVYRRSPHITQLRLHQTYGPFVRLGPNAMSVYGGEYTSQIYGIVKSKNFIKSDFYAVFQNIVNGRRAASLVAMTDESDHARTKRAIAHAYSLSTLVEFEPLVDSTINVLLKELGEKFANWEDVCDLGQYLQWFAFDVIGELTFSKRLGFLEQGEDIDGIISAIGSNFAYFSVLGQMPWLDNYLGKNPIYVRYFRKSVSSPILVFAQKLLDERLSQVDSATTSEKSEAIPKPDFLSRFLSARNDVEDASLMSDGKLLSYLFMNINAGSDTIASTVRAIFYYLLTNQPSLSKLITELQSASDSSHLTLPCPTWTETQSLPYLCAVIKEGLRLNPALSLPLERVVPLEGVTLQPSPDDSSVKPLHLPGGTIVGINPWVQHRHPAIFGSEPESWNPDRWLTAQEKETKSMEHALLAFGAGKRSCLGKNIAMLELHKVVPALLMRFKIELVDGGKGWTVRNNWALDQKGLNVRIEERVGS